MKTILQLRSLQDKEGHRSRPVGEEMLGRVSLDIKS